MRKVVRFVIFCLGFSLFHCESQYINKKLWKDNSCTLWRCQVCKVSSPCSYAENYTFLRILIFLNFRNSPMFFTYCKDHRKRGLFFNSNWTHLQLNYFAILPTTLKSKNSCLDRQATKWVLHGTYLLVGLFTKQWFRKTNKALFFSYLTYLRTIKAEFFILVTYYLILNKAHVTLQISFNNCAIFWTSTIFLNF